LQTVTRPCLDNFLQISFQASINICRTSDSAIIWLFQFLVKLWTDPKHMTFGLLDSPSHTTTHTARGVQQVEHSLSPSSLFTYWELYAHQGHILLFYARRIAYPCTDIYKPDSSTSFTNKNKEKNNKLIYVYEKSDTSLLDTRKENCVLQSKATIKTTYWTG
jgi:hypothetical protein